MINSDYCDYQILDIASKRYSLLTLAYLNPTDSDLMVSVNAETVGNHTRPVTMRVTRDLESARVSGVSIVSTLCSDSH